jgi:hypothetical protein
MPCNTPFVVDLLRPHNVLRELLNCNRNQGLPVKQSLLQPLIDSPLLPFDHVRRD